MNNQLTIELHHASLEKINKQIEDLKAGLQDLQEQKDRLKTEINTAIDAEIANLQALRVNGEHKRGLAGILNVDEIHASTQAAADRLNQIRKERG